MSAERRLMDMLAGWAGSADLDDEVSAIADLYQQSATPDELTDEQVREFVINRVIPLLLKGA